MTMAFKLLFIVLLAMVAPAVHGVEHTVGGSDRWSQSTDLATWASGKTFTVGDTLVFSYSTMHSLDVVSKTDYENCNSANALRSFNDGQTTVSLLTPGRMYFICPTAGHCSSGMKLSINVVAAASTPSAKAPTSGDKPPPAAAPKSGDKPPPAAAPKSGDKPPSAAAPSGDKTPSAAAPGGDKTPSILSPPSDSTTDSDGSSDSTPTTPSTTTARSSPESDDSGVEGHFGHFSRGMVGFSLVMAGLVALMG